MLVHYCFDSVQGADAHLTQVLVLKLYKEYADSAFAVWAQHRVPDVASLFGGARAVEAAAAAAAGGSEVVGLGLGLSCEAAKTVLQEVLSARKQVGAAAVATAKQTRPCQACRPEAAHILRMCWSWLNLITLIIDRHCCVLNHVLSLHCWLTTLCQHCTTTTSCCRALQLEVELAERRARAEEEGLDEEEDSEHDLRMVSQLSRADVH